MSIRIGSEVFDQNGDIYTVEDFINRGAFGEVYKIVSRKTKEVKALKTIFIGFAKDEDILALQNEGNLAPQVNNENVNKVHYFHPGDEYQDLPPYMIMDYAADGTLKGILENQISTGEYFSTQVLIELLLQLAKGMEALNAKLVHRDLKPDNILVHRGVLKISDFGLSKIEGAVTRSMTFKGVQHIHYKAPESWLLDTNNKSMDMYSMGIIFFELSTLKHPYKIDTLIDPFTAWKEAHLYAPIPLANTINNKLPNNIVEVISKMVNKRPVDRYDDWSQIISRLKSGIEDDHQSTSLDITKLIQKAQQNKQQQVEKELEIQISKSRLAEKRKLIDHRFEKIKDAIRLLTERFNNNSDSVQIEIEETGDKIHASVPSRNSVINDYTSLLRRSNHLQQVFATYKYMPNELKYRKKEVLAWGYVINSLDETGFNILLVKENDEDIYGSWVTFHNETNPIVRQERRKSPFAITEEREFIRKVNVIGAMDTIQTIEGEFNPEQLLPLFESIFN